MEPRLLDTADELCKLTQTKDVFDYLELDLSASSEEALRTLKERRKYLQGMQANPKFKEEARFIIRNFTNLQKVLAEPDAYRSHLVKVQESAHIPVVEMTIQGVLAGDRLSLEQEAYLRKNAKQLGVSESTFEEILNRLCGERGIERPKKPVFERPPSKPNPYQPETPPQGSPRETNGTEPPKRRVQDYYRVLGVDSDASDSEILATYEAQRQQAQAIANSMESRQRLAEIENAYRVLGRVESRSGYDRMRETMPTHSPTHEGALPRSPGPTSPKADWLAKMPGGNEVEDEPPPLPTGLRGKSVAPDQRGPRLEIDGPLHRIFQVGDQIVRDQISLFVHGDGPINAQVTSDQDWLLVQPNSLDPSAPEQVLAVEIVPQDLALQRDEGRVILVTDEGERVEVLYEVKRQGSAFGLIAAGIAAFLLVVGAVVVWALTSSSGPQELTVHVDPSATQILLNGELIGSGHTAFVTAPPRGQVTLEAVPPNDNFVPYSGTFEVGRADQTASIPLKLARPIDYVPPENAKRGQVEPSALQRLMTSLDPAMRSCLQAVTSPEDEEGKIKIHVGPDGLAIGVEFQGQVDRLPTVKECLQRQAAAVVNLSPLTEGDYATVLYEYKFDGTAEAGAPQ